MTYIELINRFWSIFEQEPFSLNEVALYFYLLKECNRRGWPNIFEYPNRNLSLALGIAESTLIRLRNQLKQRGVLDFQPGRRNGGSPIYHFYLQNESKNASKIASKNASKIASKIASKNASPINSIDIKTKDLRITDDDGARARVGEESPDDIYSRFLARVFSPSRRGSNEQVCMSRGLTIDEFKRLAQEVVGEWRFREMPLADFNESARHLLSAISVKQRINNETKSKNETDKPQARGVSDDEFKAHIASKLARGGVR